MSESDSQELSSDVIKSTKTVLIAEDVHNAIGHIATDEDSTIKTVVDEILRSDDSVQRELQFRSNNGE
jgi:hypothetical protein